MARSAWSRPASARSRCGGRRSATAAPARAVASASASPRPSCPAGRGGPGAWMRCCRCSTCAGSPWATPGRRSRRCRARTRRTCRRRWSRGCGANGRRTTRAGSGATCRPGATCMSGPTASTCRRAWSRKPSACWCRSAPPRKAKRNSWAFGSACGKARRAGGSCWPTSRRAAWPSRPNWPPATAPSASGRRWRRSSLQRGTSGAGCTPSERNGASEADAPLPLGGLGGSGMT